MRCYSRNGRSGAPDMWGVFQPCPCRTTTETKEALRVQGTNKLGHCQAVRVPEPTWRMLSDHGIRLRAPA